MTLDQRDPATCKYPPHPDGLAAGEVARPRWSDGGSTAATTFRWVKHAPAERAPAVAIPAVWTASEIMHAVHMSAAFPGISTLVAAGLAFGIGERRSRGEHPSLKGAEVAAITGVTGAWLTAATAWGPLTGPDHLLTIAYAAGSLGGYWWLRKHEAIRAARARRDAAAAERAKRAEWHRLAELVGLRGSHLVEIAGNNNGEVWLIDLYSTRKLATQVDCKQLAQRLAGERIHGRGRGVRRNWVEVTPDPEWPYKLRVFFRDGDPWKGGSADAFIWHPSATGTYDPKLPFAELAPPRASITDPIAIGADPETGQPLQIELFAEDGAQRVLICATSGAGKSNLLDTIRERVTACEDARLIQLNLSKGVEDSWWQPLTAASALASDPDPAARALAILDFITDAIKRRPQAAARKAGARWHRPTPDEPAFVVIIDEYNVVAEDPDRRLIVENVASKCRSEGIPLILATQRPAGKWVSTSIKANISRIVWAKMRASDARHMAGSDGFELPDIGAYGGDNKGIFGVARHPTHPDMPFQRGRAFFWGDDSKGLLRLVKERTDARQPYVLEPALAPLAEQWAAITSGGVPDGGRYDVTTTKTGTTVAGVSSARARFAAVASKLDDEFPSPAGDDDEDDDDAPEDHPRGLSADARKALAVYRSAAGRLSSTQLGEQCGWGKTKAYEVISELRDAGQVQLQGGGRAAGFEGRQDAPREAPRAPLRLVPDPDPDAQDAS